MNTLYLNFGERVPFNFTGLAVSAIDSKHWYKEGKRHRIDGPAIIWSDGTKIWFFEGCKHREDGPAIEYADGVKHWYLNGSLYVPEFLECLISEACFLGKQKGRYNLDWLKFMTEKEIVEFPIMPGMLEHSKNTNVKQYEKIKGFIDDNKT